MKLGLVGYGRMGKEIERVARGRGHEVCVVFEIDRPLTPASDLQGAQVLIDFSYKDAVLATLEAAARLGVPVVEGTTGWTDQLDRLQSIPKLTVLHSPNFSMGVYQFRRIVEQAARWLGPLGDYDCYLHEWHHAGKADSPSGTARYLAEVLIQNLPGKSEVLYSTCDRKIHPHELHVTSTRVGRVPGTHEVGFDSVSDSILLRHTAHGREAFAHGAVRAAEWIVGKQGIFSMEDFMDSISGSNGKD